MFGALGALVYFMLTGGSSYMGDMPYVDKAQSKRNAEWRKNAPPPNLNYQQVGKT